MFLNWTIRKMLNSSTEGKFERTVAAPKLILLVSYAMLNISREGHTHTYTDKIHTLTHTDKGKHTHTHTITSSHKQSTLTLSSPCDFI